jgi:hypothetical protein
MNMDHVGNLLARPRLYYNIDGLGELGGSVMCLGYAPLLWLLMRSPADSVWQRSSLFAFIGLMSLIHYGTKAVKTRITYPRTGFVEYRKRWHTAAIAAVLGALASAGLAVGFRRSWDISMLAPLTGLIFAAVYGDNFARAVRWKWIFAGAMVLASFAIAVLPADVLGALGSESPAHPDRAKLLGTILLSLMAYGTMLLISGGISFWLYLRHTPAPAQEGQ